LETPLNSDESLAAAVRQCPVRKAIKTVKIFQ
jgi:hypothetical protein